MDSSGVGTGDGVVAEELKAVGDGVAVPEVLIDPAGDAAPANLISDLLVDRRKALVRELLWNLRWRRATYEE